MPDDSKYGNASSSSNLKDGSTASMSSAAERQQQAAAAYDDALQRAAGTGADFSRHTETIGSGYSAGANAASTPSAVSTDIRDTAPNTYSAGVMGTNHQTGGVEQGFVAAASQVLPPRLPRSQSNRSPAPLPPAWSSKVLPPSLRAVPTVPPPRSET